MEHESELLVEIKRLNTTITKLNKQGSVWHAFWRGILSGLGSVVGATIVFAAVAYLLRQVDVVPLIGNWLSQIAAHVLDTLSQQ